MDLRGEGGVNAQRTDYKKKEEEEDGSWGCFSASFFLILGLYKVFEYKDACCRLGKSGMVIQPPGLLASFRNGTLHRDILKLFKLFHSFTALGTRFQLFSAL